MKRLIAVLLLMLANRLLAQSPATEPSGATPLQVMRDFRSAVMSGDRDRVLALMVDPDDDERQRRLAYFMDPAMQTQITVEPLDEVVDGDVATVINRQDNKKTGKSLYVSVPAVRVDGVWRLYFGLSDKAAVPAEQRERARKLMQEKGFARAHELERLAKAATQPTTPTQPTVR